MNVQQFCENEDKPKDDENKNKELKNEGSNTRSKL